MFIRSLHNAPTRPFINPFYENRMQNINRSLCTSSAPMNSGGGGGPMPPNIGLILLGGALFWYVFYRRM